MGTRNTKTEYGRTERDRPGFFVIPQDVVSNKHKKYVIGDGFSLGVIHMKPTDDTIVGHIP